MIKQTYEQPAPVKLLINIGALLDVPTGFYIKGARGENILLGGLGGITAVVGRGNRYKSTVMHFMMLSAMNRLMETVDTSASTFDTEINIHETALKRFMNRFNVFQNRDIIDNGEWVITDKTKYYANKWYEKAKEFLKFKEDNQKDFTYKTPFLSRDKQTNLKVIVPTFGEVDSFSEFETEDVAKMQDENELGESGGNTIHMRQGLAKTRFLMEIPNLFGSVNHFLLMTAHLGDAVNIATSPYAAPPVKKLQHMPQGDKIKGVTDKFFFLMNNCWHAKSSTPMVNQATKTVEYPKDSGDDGTGYTDLNLVTLVQLRGKSGPSGFEIPLVVSQFEGVLPGLTEFHYIKNSERFGISGTLQNYSLDLLPEVKLSRTTVRGKIDTDLKLQRALNITSELCQMHEYYRGMKDKLCTPKQLYEDIKKLGYDWDDILTNTRGWWTLEDDKHPLKFLSTLDLCEMRLELYKPYWMK